MAVVLAVAAVQVADREAAQEDQEAAQEVTQADQVDKTSASKLRGQSEVS